MTSKHKGLLAAAVCLAGAATVGAWLLLGPGHDLPQARLDCSPALVEELMSVGEYYRGPEADATCSEVAYARCGEGSRRLFLLSTMSGQERQFTNASPILRFSGYSSDGERFLFKSLIHGAEALSVYDRRQGRARRVRYNRGLANDVVWTSSNVFCFSHGHAQQVALYLTTLTGEEESTEELDTQGPATSLAPMGPRKVAFVRDSEIWVADFDSKQCAPLSQLADGAKPATVATRLEWLNYSPEAGAFLFCAGDQSNWRHVFRYSNRGGREELKALTFDIEHSYNGRWIQRGTGFAFIGNLTNRFYLAVRPAEANNRTNLFSGGHVSGYCVSADGESLFAIASVGAEPPGIWRYAISKRELRYLGGRAELSLARAIPRQERWVKSFDGLQVAYYLIEPRDLDRSRKYPAVVSVPPEGNQFYRAWEKYSQLFGNMGVFDVSVNHRAVDGYGNLYRRQNAGDSYKDVMAVYGTLKRNRSVDKQRVFLRSYSSGERVIERLVSEYPGLWAGVIIISGSPPPEEAAALRRSRLLLFVGKRDNPRLVSANQEFEQWARTNGLAIQAIYAPGTGHVITDLNVDRRLGFALADFIFHPGQPQSPAFAGPHK